MTDGQLLSQARHKLVIRGAPRRQASGGTSQCVGCLFWTLRTASRMRAGFNVHAVEPYLQMTADQPRRHAVVRSLDADQTELANSGIDLRSQQCGRPAWAEGMHAQPPNCGHTVRLTCAWCRRRTDHNPQGSQTHAFPSADAIDPRRLSAAWGASLEPFWWLTPGMLRLAHRP